MPSTHTPRAARPDREFTDGPPGATPLPFAASSNIAAVLIVAAMSAVVTVMSVVAVLRLYADHPARNGIAVGFVVLLLAWVGFLALPAVIARKRRQQTAAHGHSSGAQLAQPTTSTGPATRRDEAGEMGR